MDKKPLLVLSALAGGIVTSSLALAEESGNAAYKLVECNGVWQLLRAGETRAVPASGLIQTEGGPRIRLTSPPTPGACRLFAQVGGEKGHVGYANVPFYVRPQQQPAGGKTETSTGPRM